MLPLRAWSVAVVLALGATLGPRAAWSADGPPAEPTALGGSATVRKPAMPASFLSQDGGWIKFHYPPSARERVGALISQADGQRARLGQLLGPPLLDGVEIRFARGADEMATLAPEAVGSSPRNAAETAAITYPLPKLVVLSLGEPGSADPGDLGDTFRRELGRVALHRAILGRTIPSWFSEGFSTEFSGADNWSNKWLLFQAYVRKRIAPLSALDGLIVRGGSDAALARAEGADFVGFLLRPETRSRLADCVERVRKGEPLASALAFAYGKAMPDLEEAWREGLGKRCTVTLMGVAAAPVAFLVGVFAVRSMRRRRARRETTARLAVLAPAAQPVRVHIVMTRRDDSAPPQIIPEVEVPRVEHEGEWHTLH
jgi:hypothetical protein